jgi:hypothetical protein
LLIRNSFIASGATFTLSINRHSSSLCLSIQPFTAHSLYTRKPHNFQIYTLSLQFPHHKVLSTFSSAKGKNCPHSFTQNVRDNDFHSYVNLLLSMNVHRPPNCAYQETSHKVDNIYKHNLLTNCCWCLPNPLRSSTLAIQNEQHRRVKSYGPRLAWFCERCECPTKGLAGVNCALFAYLYYMGVNNNLERKEQRTPLFVC